ncbi:MAG: PQQ-binding-like beta-propeller repeat protein [Ignavibacteriales bacterium]|nr:PQQ-binding-like beta-propeller repeat protein [Ignavibacteriales bacterium]
MYNKKRKVYLYLIILFLTNLTLAQVDTAWTITYGSEGNNIGIFAMETMDSNYIVLSSNRIIGTRNMVLTKANSEGQIIWEKIFETSSYDQPRSLVESSDSGFVIFGDIGYPEDKALLIKTDKDGDTLWTKTFSSSSDPGFDMVSMKGHKIIKSSEGGYILLGIDIEMDPDGKLWLAKIDENGNIEWSQKIFVPIFLDRDYFDILENDLGYFISANDGDPGGIYFIQTDKSGNEIFRKNNNFLGGISQSISSISFGVQNNVDSGYVLTGENMGNLMVARIDMEGNIMWEREYERFAPSINQGLSVINDYDDGYALTGDGSNNLFVMKVDKEGNKIWAKVYENSWGKSIRKTSDNGYIVCGTKDQKVWLLKFKTTPVAIANTDPLWLDNNWDGYATNILDGSSSFSPNGFAITQYEWMYNENVVSTESNLEITLPNGDNIVQLKVTDENGISGSNEYVVKVCSYKLETNGAITSSISTLNDSIFYATSTDDQIYCFNNNNNLNWTLQTGGAIQSTTTIGPNGNIYVGSDDTRLYCFDPLGNFKWDTPMGGVISASPAITQNKTIYVGTENNRLYSVNGTNGEINWNYLTGGPITSSVSLASSGNIYFGSSDKKFYSLNSSGNLNWNFTTNGEIHSSPAIDNNGRIYFGSNDAKLYALNSDGTLAWSFSTIGSVKSSPVIDLEGNIYFGSADGNFYSVDPDGNENWKYNAAAPVNGNPTLTRVGNVIFGCDDGRVISLSKDGGLNWSFKTDNSIVSAPLNTAKDGRIYVGSSDNSIYGFVDLSPLSAVVNHQWPTFQKDTKRTGSQSDIVIGVNTENNNELPTEFELFQNYPNPFNPATKIKFQLAETSKLELNIFNIAGEKVKLLNNDIKNAGYYSIDWNGLNDQNEEVSSGIYIFQMKAISKSSNFQKSIKMIKLK